MKRKSIVGVTYFELIEEYGLSDTEFTVYSFMLARLQYVNKLTIDGKQAEDFNIDEDGFGRFSLTYKEAEKRLHIKEFKFKNAIRELNERKLLYYELIPNSKGNAEVNIFYPVLPDGILAWEHWAFRVHKPYGDFIEKSDDTDNLSLADAINLDNFGEKEEIVVNIRPRHII